MHLYDFSGARPSPAAMAAVPGCVGVMRYVNQGLTRAEVASYHAVGLAVGLIYEANADDLDHPERAANIANRANVLCDALGAPGDVPCFFCDDRNDPASAGVVSTNWHTIAAATSRPDGEYGSSADLDATGPTYGWQVETWVPHRGYVSPFAHMVQLANTHAPVIPGVPVGDYDTDLVVKPFPLWGPDGTTGGGTPSTSTEDPMGVSVYWRNDAKNAAGAWATRIVQGDVILLDCAGGPGVLGFPVDYVYWHDLQNDLVKSQVSPVLVGAGMWDSLTQADHAARTIGGSVDPSLIKTAVQDAVDKAVSGLHIVISS